MKIYIAAMHTSNFSRSSRAYDQLNDREKQARNEIPYVLESYHYIHKETFVKKIREDKEKVFLDSGAFSAFTKGVDVNLEEYCEYIHRNKDIIEVASVLDGIGDPLETYQNQKRMEALGCAPLPCFHYGEDERYLQYYIENYEYITLGGMVPISTPQLKLWLDRIWDLYLTDENGYPRVKVHGFGLTTVSLMERYPWYSVDSSSWVQMASNGAIYLPQYGAIPISEKSPQAKNEGQHFLNRPVQEQQAIRGIIEDYGFEVERMVTNYRTRWTFNAWIYTVLNKQYNEKPRTFTLDQPSLF